LPAMLLHPPMSCHEAVCVWNHMCPSGGPRWAENSHMAAEGGNRKAASA
jgi:hypothetical protein